MNPYIPPNTTVINLFPPRTVPEALTAGVLGMGSKLLSALILGCILFLLLPGIFFGYINLAGQEGDFKSVMDSLRFLLPQNAHITKADLTGILPVLFVGMYAGILFLPLCCDFVLFHLKMKESREGMKDEFGRRLRKNSLLIVTVYVFAIATAPIARYGEGTTALSMSATLAGFCLVALIANVLFVALDTLANQLLWNASLVFHKRYF